MTQNHFVPGQFNHGQRLEQSPAAGQPHLAACKNMLPGPEGKCQVDLREEDLALAKGPETPCNLPTMAFTEMSRRLLLVDSLVAMCALAVGYVLSCPEDLRSFAGLVGFFGL